MERRATLRVLLVCLLVVSFVLPVSAQTRSRGRSLYGDWRIKMQFGQGEFESILAFSRNQEGQYTGQWISGLGVIELTDVKFEENKLSFTHTMRFREEITSKFTGTVDVEQGELKGVLVNDRGESDITGKRERRARGSGSWDMKIQAGEREYAGILTITADDQRNLIGTWKSARGESKLSDVRYQYQDRQLKLSFTRVIERNGNRMEMAFEGTVGRNSLEGVYKGDTWEAKATGTLIGAAIMGTWNLDITGEQRSYKQRLRVNSDMSALYGSTLVKKVDLDEDKLSFDYTVQFGDQEIEVSFEGQVAESKLTGELTTSRGTSKVTGTRRPSRRRGSSRN